jgi:HD-GYP domain-containing protein (c-di-GMP phosphodiesterase class II)
MTEAINGVIDMGNRMAKEIRELSKENQRKIEEIRDARESAETLLCNLMDLFSPQLGGHGQRVARLVDEVTRRMGLPESNCKVIHNAALFHEIGMLGVPREALFAPWEKLSDMERNLILGHPDMGATLLKPMSWYQDAATLISAHHEHWDGSGFPHHTGKESIPLGARIITICDTYDEMLNKPKDAPRAFSEEEVLAHIKKQRGGHFDPKIVDIFLEQCIREDGATGKNIIAAEIPVSLGQLRSGMCLTRDLCNASGMVMLAKGTVLQEAFVLRLQGLRDSRAISEPVFVRID